MTPTVSHDTVHQRLPCEQFYWAALAAPTSTRRGERRPHRRTWVAFALTRNLRVHQTWAFEFEESLPLPLESVHAVYLRLPDARVLACAIDRERLAALAPEALTLTPVSLPAHLPDALTIDPASINLLQGEFMPTPLRAARRRSVWVLAAALSLISVTAAIGFARRAIGADRLAATRLSLAEHAMLDALPAPSPQAGLDLQPTPARFASALRAARQSNANVNSPAAPDLTHALDALLDLVHAGASASPKVDSISLSDASLALSVTLPSSDAAQAWIARASAIERWSLEPPSVSSAGGTARHGARLALRWTPASAAQEPAR